MSLLTLTVVTVMVMAAVTGVVSGAEARDGLCSTDTDQDNIVLDLMESVGGDFGQETVPGRLPLAGDPGVDIALELVLPPDAGQEMFRLEGKRLRLTRPLDRDVKNRRGQPLSSIVFQVGQLCQHSPLSFLEHVSDSGEMYRTGVW